MNIWFESAKIKFTIKFRRFLFSCSFDWQDLSNTVGHTLPSIDPRPHYSGLRDLKTQQFPKICYFCLRKTWLEKPHVNLHTKTQSRLFQIPPIWRGFSKCSVIKWRNSIERKSNRRIKVTFFKFLERGEDGTSMFTDVVKHGLLWLTDTLCFALFRGRATVSSCWSVTFILLAYQLESFKFYSGRRRLSICKKKHLVFFSGRCELYYINSCYTFPDRPDLHSSWRTSLRNIW